MPKGLKRFQHTGDLHFITFSCHRRLPNLGYARSRDAFERLLESIRIRYNFWINAYVVMPEHVHLLVSEPERDDLATVIKVLKQSISCRLKPPAQQHFWQPRYYDFNVYSELKRAEKVDYIHWNPVKRGLVATPEAWRWSSFRHYATGEQYIVTLRTWRTEQERLAALAATSHSTQRTR
jgi:putative transposase